ncbi:XTP/dITP diphosphatase [Candidatus Nomurabacteria bacterium]|nr:XTP/dITP diphosphatase [Candidatus Nomurabacteria bacterium]
MKEIIVATKNKGKLREIKGLLEDLGFKVTSLADYPHAPQIIEDGKTFEANALKKATTIAFYTKKLVMGEDSGIQIKALGNRPGVYSARYAGENATDKKNNLKLLRELKGVPLTQRQARYRCCIALVDTRRRFMKVISGSCSGIIETHHRGKNGFGYDPLFLISRYGKTFGELDPMIKAKISHRARALRKVKKVLQGY